MRNPDPAAEEARKALEAELSGVVDSLNGAVTDGTREGAMEAVRLRSLLMAFRVVWPRDRPLTFVAFRDEFPDFPIAMHYHPVPWARRDVDPLALLRSDRFHKTPIYRAYADIVRHRSPDELGALAMVFPWSPGTDMVLHSSSLVAPSTRLMVEMADSTYLYLELFKPFLAAAARLWRT